MVQHHSAKLAAIAPSFFALHAPLAFLAILRILLTTLKTVGVEGNLV